MALPPGEYKAWIVGVSEERRGVRAEVAFLETLPGMGFPVTSFFVPFEPPPMVTPTQLKAARYVPHCAPKPDIRQRLMMMMMMIAILAAMGRVR